MNKKLVIFAALIFSINGHANDFETEPNNIIDEADPIFQDVTLNGNTSSENDEEWFFFNTTGSDVLTVTLSSNAKTVFIYE